MQSAEVSYGDFVAGWLPSSTHEFLATYSPNSANTRFALITCLDSHSHPAELLQSSPELKPLAEEAQVVGSGFLVSTSLLLKQGKIFYGFDEVWFFPNREIEPKPDGATLVGPARIDQARMTRLGEWLTRNHGSLGLGGGEGLNFIVKAPRPARYVIANSMEHLDSGLGEIVMPADAAP